MPGKKQSQGSKLFYLMVLCVAFVFGLCACSKSPNTTRSSEFQPQPVSTLLLPVAGRLTPTPAPATKSLPAKPDEVNNAMFRVFNGAAKIDSDYTPSWLMGDFNGDGSQDVAI